MGRKRGGGGKKQQREKKNEFGGGLAGALTGIITGKYGEEAKRKAIDILNGDSDFVSWWQRRTGESVLSTQNVIKAAGLFGAYLAYRHFDPFPGSKVDNATVTLITVVLAALLAIPQSTELGAHFKSFEADVLLATKGFKDGKQQEEVWKFIRGLSNRQENRLACIFSALKTSEEGKEFLAILLGEEVKRNLLKELIGEDPQPTDIRKFVEENWPWARDKLRAADAKSAAALTQARAWLNERGIRRRRARTGVIRGLREHLRRCWDRVWS